MPITTECPECGKRLKAPDSAAGRRAKCPQCGAAVPIPEAVYDAEEVFDPEESYDEDEGESYGLEAPAAPPPPRRADTEARRPCPVCGEMIKATAVKCRYCGEPLAEDLKRSDARLGTVRTGVGLIYYGLVTALGSAILGAVLAAALKSPTVMMVFLFLAVAGMIAMFVGKLLCLAVPPEVGATGLIYTSVALDFVGIALNIGQAVTEVPALLLVGGIGGVTANILFLLFLKKLCEFIRRSDLTSLANQVVTLFVVLIAGYMLLLAVLVARNQALAIVGGISLFILALVAVLRYGRLLTFLKDAL